jgi:hypothetical protein
VLIQSINPVVAFGIITDNPPIALSASLLNDAASAVAALSDFELGDL